MPSNCYLWAKRELARREREWRKAGSPPGLEPYQLTRPTRLRGNDWLADWIARRVRHYLVGWRDLQTGTLRTISYGPADKRYRLHWWEMPRVLLFSGRIVEGDTHLPTEPPRG